jgi:hypothetical protein
MTTEGGAPAFGPSTQPTVGGSTGDASQYQTQAAPVATIPQCQAFEAAVARVMRIRGLSRTEAERVAFEIVLVKLLNLTHPNTNPRRCAHCARLETSGETLRPIGCGERHAWLHSNCWEPWRGRRRAEAIAALAEAGVSI